MMSVTSSSEHQLITVSEAAIYLKIDRVTAWRWCTQGKIPAVQLGRSWRVDRRALEKMISQSLERHDVPLKSFN